MRDPNNINVVADTGEDITIVEIHNVPEFDIQDYDLLDDKDFKKYMKKVELIIRTSYEYKQLVAYLKNNLDMNKCSFYENVSNLDSRRIKIHIHHEPITLYDICIVVFNKRTMYHESLSEEMLAKEVMFLHYNLMVGLIPLAETPHELVHNNYLFVPTNKVMGKYKEFVDRYREFFLPEQLDILDRIEKATLEYNAELQAKKVLAKNYIYLDLSESMPMPTYDYIIKQMNDRINELKGNKPKLPKAVIYHGKDNIK